MRTGQKKRKRPTANNDITSSTTTSSNNNNNTSSNNNNRGRQRLQRASKDKVYAERLAAAGNDNDFNCLLSTNNDNNGSGIDDNINTQEVGACAMSQQSNTNGSKRSTRSSKSTTTSFKSTANTSTSNSTRSKRSRSTRRNTEKVLSPPPPNWPFTSNSTSSNKGGGKTAKGVDNKGGRKKSIRDGNGKSSGDKLSLPPNWPFTESTSKSAKSAAKAGGGGKKKSSSSRGTSSRKSKDSTSCESSTGVSTNVVVDDDKKKKGQKYKQQPVAPRKQSLQQLRKEEEEQDVDVVGKEEIMSTTRSTRSGKVREMKSTAAAAKAKSVDKECAGHSELVDSDEDNDEVEKKKVPVSMKQPTIDKLSPPTSISSTKSSAVVSKKSGGVSSKKKTKSICDKLSPPTLQNHTEPVSKAKAAPKTTKPSASIDKLSPPTLQNHTKPAPSKAAPKAKATTTDWSCNRCTLLNNNRKKKCTACGTPRYLTVGLDGTFALDESRSGGGSTAAVREETKSCEAAAANADEDEDEGEQSEESQQSQLSAMIDAPVFTRSRRKEHLSLTQPSSPIPKPVAAKDKVEAQAKEDIIDYNDCNDQPEENDGSQSSSNHIPLQLEQQQQEEQQNEDNEAPSEFKQWIQKRHEKKREKKAKKRQRRKSLVPVKVVTVRPLVNGEHILLDSNDASMNVDEEQSESSQQQQQQLALEAVVEISVLCRIEERSNEQQSGAAASEDNERGEQSTPQESDSSEKPLKDAEKSVCQERPMEDEGNMEQKLPQGSTSEEVQPKSEEESSTTETTRPTDDDLITKLAASTLLNMQGVSVEIPSSELQGPAQQDQVSDLKESAHDSTLTAKSEAGKPSSKEIPEDAIHPEKVTDHINKQLDKDDCAEEVADVCRHDDTVKLAADTLNGGGNSSIFNYDEISQSNNIECSSNKLNEQESYICDGRQKEETLISNENPRKKDDDKSQQNQVQVAYHEEAKRDQATSTKYPSNSQGVASIHSPFIQMTQQLPDFDYMSQVRYYVLFITQITLNLFHVNLKSNYCLYFRLHLVPQ